MVNTNPRFESTITPEPKLLVLRSRGWSGILKKCRKKGSENNGLWRCLTRPSVAIFTTAGVTSSNIGARLGNSLPSNPCGKTAFAETVKNEHAANKTAEKNFGNVLIIFLLLVVFLFISEVSYVISSIENKLIY